MAISEGQCSTRPLETPLNGLRDHPMLRVFGCPNRPCSAPGEFGEQCEKEHEPLTAIATRSQYFQQNPTLWESLAEMPDVLLKASIFVGFLPQSEAIPMFIQDPTASTGEGLFFPIHS